MGPPPSLDYPPRPMEIDLNSNGLGLHNSRTLPSPSLSAPAAWDSAIFQSHGCGDGPYGSSNPSRTHTAPIVGHIRIPQQNPLAQWYEGNDGPWIPKEIMNGTSDERSQPRFNGSRISTPYSHQQRSLSHIDSGNYPFGVPPSDSGYGTRQSVGNTSVYSGDINLNERETDTQSYTGHPDYQSFQGYNETLTVHNRTPRSINQWDAPNQSTPPRSSSCIVCPICCKQVKTQSELKYEFEVFTTVHADTG